MLVNDRMTLDTSHLAIFGILHANFLGFIAKIRNSLSFLGIFSSKKIAFFSGNSSLFRASTLFFRAKQTIFKKSLKNYQTSGNETLTRVYTPQYRDGHKNLTRCISVGRVGMWSFGHLVIKNSRKRGGTTIIVRNLCVLKNENDQMTAGGKCSPSPDPPRGEG